jgi:hypothetical protein
MLKILLLHAMGPPKKWFVGVSDVELMFSLYDKNNKYIVHNAFIKLPKLIQDYPFDAIIIMSTFMDKVTSKGLSSRWIKQYDFIKYFAGIKIVFPQDDYWFSEIRDKFYVDYGIDRVHPVCPKESWQELIPKYIQSGGNVKQGYTTYITPRLRDLQLLEKPYDERKNHVVYRAKKIPTAPNRFGYIKGVLGDCFLGKVDSLNFSFDISTNPKDLIHGEKWHQFIANSKAILGSNSGSSVRLRNKEVFQRLRDYQLKHTEKTGDEVEEAVFAPNDREKEYTAISPRNIEAAMLGTLQILVKGPYGHILRPNIDYVALLEDCGNANSLMEIVEDEKTSVEIINNCKERLFNAHELQVENIISDTILFIVNNLEKKLGSRNKKSRIRFETLSKFNDSWAIISIHLKSVYLEILTKISKFLPSSLYNFLRSFKQRYV